MIENLTPEELAEASSHYAERSTEALSHQMADDAPHDTPLWSLPEPTLAAEPSRP